MPLELFDTLSREYKPVVASSTSPSKSFEFYCCGPTVYGPAHIGNFRTFVTQDIFRRVTELSGVPTFHVRNITDVDDKTIRDSQKEGKTLAEFTAGWNAIFQQDCEALNCLPPHEQPSAVEHIPQQIDMAKTLVDKGFAYASEDGSVYFKVSAFEEYGRLSRLNERDLDLGRTANERSDADEYDKESVSDFVLWKGRKEEDGENYWQSPWGEGRPGWHLECSAMIRSTIGDTIDLHSGGVDLIFPHHENEIAQSECTTGQTLARHWFHVTHLLVDGGKMSKSLGNFYTLGDLVEKGYDASQVRFVLANGHYRKSLNFLLSALDEAQSTLDKFRTFAELLEEKSGAALPSYEQCVEGNGQGLGAFEGAWASLLKDLNVPEALGKVFTAMKALRTDGGSAEELTANCRGFAVIMHALGLDLSVSEVSIPEEVTTLAERRWQAKQDKDWAVCDQMRDELTSLGWQVKDSKEGYEVLPL